MLRLTIFLLVFAVIGCNLSTNKMASYWERQKPDFLYSNKKEFRIDSTMQAELKSFKRLKHPLFDSLFGGDSIYLYSWQNRDTSTHEFTVIIDDGDVGYKIYYLILDKKDSLLSSTQIAGRGTESFYWFETQSRFISPDTAVNTASVTKFYDFEQSRRLVKTIGDSTFSYLVIDPKGKVTEKVFKEVKALHFENE